MQWGRGTYISRVSEPLIQLGNGLHVKSRRFDESLHLNKIFGHVHVSGEASNFTYDYPYSWSMRPYIPSAEKYKNAKVGIQF